MNWVSIYISIVALYNILASVGGLLDSLPKTIRATSLLAIIFSIVAVVNTSLLVLLPSLILNPRLLHKRIFFLYRQRDVPIQLLLIAATILIILVIGGH